VRVARVRRALGASLASLALAVVASAETYSALAVHVRDGDSLIVDDGSRQRELRIAEIDAPEHEQPWSREARRALDALVRERKLRVESLELDRYGREVSKLWVDEVCVACELVRQGHAWAFRKYSRDPRLLDLEREARDARRGLWAAKRTPVPPSAWRTGLRALSAERLDRYLAEERSESDPDELTCRAKPRCREMSSCAEARFHLEHCGATHLDQDGDSVPCDQRCR
jgi:endonuclease YncB( thermonuclease family)